MTILGFIEAIRDTQKWAKDAPCSTADPDQWHPEKGGPPLAASKAKAICHTCPAEVACLQYALDTREQYGVWGGMTAGERKRWLKQQEPTHCSNGHDRAVVGVWPDGTCRDCRRNYQRQYAQELKLQRLRGGAA
jgi:hypothetical protein